MVEFKKNKPVRAALHWDGKLIKDVTGSPRENEAILVSGSPHYIEGKLLAVSVLQDKSGKATSTREAKHKQLLRF